VVQELKKNESFEPLFGSVLPPIEQSLSLTAGQQFHRHGVYWGFLGSYIVNMVTPRLQRHFFGQIVVFRFPVFCAIWWYQTDGPVLHQYWKDSLQLFDIEVAIESLHWVKKKFGWLSLFITEKTTGSLERFASRLKTVIVLYQHFLATFLYSRKPQNFD
jgi:hypothetical protein